MVGGEREVQEGRELCKSMADSFNVWQKLTQYCKAIIPQLKMNTLKKRRGVPEPDLSPHPLCRILLPISVTLVLRSSGIMFQKLLLAFSFSTLQIHPPHHSQR